MKKVNWFVVLAGSGNGDSAITVFGMIVGAALAHNFGLAGNPDSVNEAGKIVVGGISTAGKVAVLLGFVVLAVISVVNVQSKKKSAVSGETFVKGGVAK